MFNYINEKVLINFFIIKLKSLKNFKFFYFYKKIFLYIFIKKHIKIKLGIDINNRNIHLGHYFLINIFKKKIFMNTKLLLILGITTSKLIDPSYRKNFKIKFDKKNIFFFIKQLNIISLKNILILFNNEWNENFNNLELNKIFFIINLINILNRNDIKLRFNKNIKINLSEIIYIIFQSYDSIFIKSNLELGGIDQDLNFVITNKIFFRFFKFYQINILFPLILNKKKKKLSKNNKLILSLNLKKNLFLKIFFKNILFKNYNDLFFIKNLKFFYNYFEENFYFFLNIFKNFYKFHFIKNVFIKNVFNKKKFNFSFIKFINFYFFNKKLNNFKKKFKLKIINNLLIKNNNFIIFKNNYKINNYLIKIC